MSCYQESQRVRNRLGKQESPGCGRTRWVEAPAVPGSTSSSLGKPVLAERTCRSYARGAWLPGGPLQWLNRVSRCEQTPSWRLPGTSHTSWYFCLRFYTHFNSQALPRGSPTATCAPESGTTGTAQQLPARTVLLLLNPSF